MPQPPPKPSPYRVLQIDDAPGINSLEITLNQFGNAGYKFVGIISTPSLGVAAIMEYQG